MVNWHNTRTEDKIKIYNEIAIDTGLPAFAVEKDWWVVKTLEIIFQMEIGSHLLFKGGTSLSKAWGLIERFSEDVDLAVDRNFLGFEGELSKKEITRLRKASNEYLASIFFPELIAKFTENGFADLNFKLIEAIDSDQDPRIIEIYYPNVVDSPGYIQPRVQVEIGCRSLREPFSIQAISSFVDQSFPNASFAGHPVAIPTVNPERTLLEKIFLLHEEFQRPVEKVRIDRMSRHLYDIYKLSTTIYADKTLFDKELYAEIVNHRLRYSRLGGVDYKLHDPKTIHPFPDPMVIEAWKQDYSKMKEQMIYGDSPDFDEMLEGIRLFISKINTLDWKIIS
jgi:predicted nucleotidyltransferase component of viral defense system